MIDKQISLAKFKAESSNIKLHNLRVVFVRLTNANSWEDVGNKFPEFATDKQLLKFIHLDLKSIPIFV